MQTRHVTDNASGSVWTTIGDFVFSAIRLNLAVAIGCLPVVAILVLAVEPLRAFPTLIFAAWLSAPGLAACFSAFRDAPGFSSGLGTHEDLSDSPAIYARFWEVDDTSILRPFFRAYRELFVRSLLTSALPLGLAMVLAVDAAWLMQTGVGRGLVPALLLVASVCLVDWLISLAFVTELREDSRWQIVKAAAYCSLRKWYLSLITLMVLALLAAGIVYAPIPMLGIAASLALYLTWANCRWSALPVLRATTENR